MKDNALALAANGLLEPGHCLWLVDENALPLVTQIPPREDLWLLGNRADVIATAQAHGHHALLNDFDFSELPECTWQRAVYRVSKEKPVMQHVLAASCALLAGHGELIITGLKEDGGKTIIEKIAKTLGSGRCVKTGSAYIGRLPVPAAYALPFAPEDYHTLSLQEVDGRFFLSKPGVYGWQKIDQGSEFLIETFTAWRDDRRFEALLDLGCGWGYLTLATARLPIARRYALDNNVAAITAAAANFEAAEIQVEVICDDALNAATHLDAPVDLILCNPPFHQGFEVAVELTDRFLQAMAASLSPQGSALAVVNAHVGLEVRAQTLFRTVIELAANRSFKIILLQK